MLTFDVLVVGSGGSGMRAALEAAHSRRRWGRREVGPSAVIQHLSRTRKIRRVPVLLRIRRPHSHLGV